MFTDIGDRPTILDITPVARLAMESYSSGDVDAVFVAYAKFVNTTLQNAVVEQLLPVQPAELRPQEQVGYIYEPDPAQVLSELLPRYVEMQIYHALLEGIASEQSAENGGDAERDGQRQRDGRGPDADNEQGSAGVDHD